MSQDGILDDKILAVAPEVGERTYCDPTERWLASSLELLLHTADKSLQGTDKSFDHAANSKSVSGLTRIIPDFQAIGIAISQKFKRMSEVARTGR